MIPAFDMNLIKRKYALRDKIARRRTRALLETLEGRGIINEPQLKEYIFWIAWKDHPLVKAVYGSYHDSLFAEGLNTESLRGLGDLSVFAGFHRNLRNRPGGPAFYSSITGKLNRLGTASGDFLLFSKERKRKALTRLFKKILKKNPEITRVYQDELKNKKGIVDWVHV